MKKIFYFAAMMALCLSCTKEQQGGSDVVDGGGDGGEVVAATEFSAEFSQEGISRTHLGTLSDGAYPNYWSVGDCINVNGSVSAALGSEYSTNRKTARFVFDNAVSQYSGNWYIGYPAGAFTSFSAGTGTVVVPSGQTYTAGTYDPEAFVMVGKTSGKSVKFYPRMGIVRVTATDAETPYAHKISKVRLDAVGGESLSGTFTTNYNGASATFTATSGNPYVEINAPTSAGLDFGSTFFFAVPVGTYSDGLRFTIYTKDDKSMSFSNTSAVEVGSGTMKNITSPAYVPSEVNLSCTFKTSSSAGFEWSAANSSNNIKKVWRLAIYSNAACTSLVVQHDIPADAGASGVWKSQSGTPRFIVGGLSQGTDYWCKVTDLANGVVSEALAFTTDEFTVVPASSPSGSTLVAEDFSEFGWGPAWLYNYAGHTYGGWAPVNGSSGVGANSLSCAAPAGVVDTGYYVANEYSANNMTGAMDFSTAPRFNAGWGFVSDGAINGYIQAGFLRMGDMNSNRSLIVLPELSGITTDKYATVDVTVKVAHSNDGDVTNNRDFAVFIERGLSLDATTRLYTGATLDRRYPVSLTAHGYNNQTLTFRVNGVKKTDHLMVGPYNKVTNYNRYFIYSVKVEKISESSTETFDITDSESLEHFRSRVAAGESSLNGNVLNSFTVSSSVASAWASIPGYTGTLEGNDNTISGLTQPFFDNLGGTVQNLKLNSQISVSDIDRVGIGILANSLTGSGSVSHCSVAGSLTVSYSSSESPNATCYVGGIVGEKDAGNVTYSENAAGITVSGAARAALFIGGIVANHTSGSLEYCSSTGGTISYSGDNPAGNLYIGGIVGYSTQAVSHCTSAMAVNVGGSFEPSSNNFYATGGIVGSMSADQPITSCTNSGNITYSQQLTATSYGYSFVAGVVGRSEGNVTSCSNSGEIQYTGCCLANYSFVGGIIGTSSTDKFVSGSNTGPITINSTTQTGTDFYVGGVAGRAGNITAPNSGKITISRLASATAYIGGIAGWAYNNVSSSSPNSGEIEISNFTASSVTYIGGVAGVMYSAGNVRASNEGDIKLNDTCLSTGGNLLVGGIVGRTTRAVYGTINSGHIDNAMNVASDAWISIGGIAGENSAGSWVGTESDSNKNDNTGNVTNTASGGGIKIGGISGNALGRICNAYNTGSIINSGNSVDEGIYVGGVAATSHQLISCYNNGDVTNTADSGNSSTGVITVGGITGYAENSAFSKCINRGAISNSGTAGKDDTYCRVGGLVGQSVGLNLSASGDNTNINYGDVTDTSDSQDSAFAGVVAYAEGNVSDFSNCRNEGTVTIGGSKTYIFTGGIAGAFKNSSVLDNTYNSGAITASGATMASSGFIRCGGIIGGWLKEACVSQTITGCTNTGSITLQPDNFGGAMGSNDSFVGGIAGGGRNDEGECGKELVNCTNSGDITMGSTGSTNSGKLYHRYCVGGIIGFTDVNPTGSKCIANIRFRSKTGTNRVGGIAGEMMIESIHDVTYKGTVNSNGAEGTNYTGGLVGNVGTGEITFNNCTVSGTMHGPNNTTTPAGIFCSNKGNGTGPTINITNCNVGSNTHLQAAASGYYITITSASDITASNVFGHNGKNRNCTAGTNSGNSVVDPDTITL